MCTDKTKLDETVITNFQHFLGTETQRRDCLLVKLIDILIVYDTKLDEDFPYSWLQTEIYQFPPFCRDRNAKVGGEMFLN